MTTDHVIPPDTRFDTFDWERSHAFGPNPPETKSLYEYLNITARRDDVLDVWPAPSPEEAGKVQSLAVFFVDHQYFDRPYPADAASRDAGGDDPLRPRPKPGPKPTGDWYTLLGAWLVKVACDDPKRLRNIDALIVDAQSFLEERIGWAPKEPQELRKKILEFLQFWIYDNRVELQRGNSNST